MNVLLTEDTIVESRAARTAALAEGRNCTRLEALLDGFTDIDFLPSRESMTVPAVAAFYGVTDRAIELLMSKHLDELSGNGMVKLSGPDLNRFRREVNEQFVTEAEFGRKDLPVSPKTRSLAVFSRRAVLNVGMLLTDSERARLLRSLMLTVVESSTVEQRQAAVARERERVDMRALTDYIRDHLTEDTGNTVGNARLYSDVHQCFNRTVSGATASKLKAERCEVDGRNGSAKDYQTGRELNRIGRLATKVLMAVEDHVEETGSLARRDVRRIVRRELGLPPVRTR